jgi:hypothetical protein
MVVGTAIPAKHNSSICSIQQESVFSSMKIMLALNPTQEGRIIASKQSDFRVVGTSWLSEILNQ